MAGGKQSPRDKLVGMMYLVLTALLALQVSSAVLDKFILINRSFESAISYQLEENNDLIKKVSKSVADSGNKQVDKDRLKRMIKIRERTDKLISHLEALKEKLIKDAGGTKKRIIGLRNDSVVANLMINNKKGAELKKLLNNYCDYLTSITKKKYSYIALDARDIDFLKNDPNQGRKNFVMLNFKKTPLAAALATLSQWICEVVYKEADAISLIASELGGEEIKVDTVVPFVIPDTSIVASGSSYKARVVLSAYSSKQAADMKVNGRSIPVRDGIGYIDIPARVSKKIKEGAMEKRDLEVSINIKNRKGESETKRAKESYYVTKPVVVIEADAVKALYLNCSNDLNVNVPAFGNAYQPNFKIKGGELINKGGGKISVIPNDKKVELSVYQKTTFVSVEKFKVRNIPLPTVKMMSGNKIVNEKDGVPAPGPRTLKFTVVPDSSFKEFLPKEARYKVTKGQLTLARSGRPVAVVPIRSGNINMAKINRAAKPGDRIVADITEITRLTSTNKKEKVQMPSIIKTIAIID